MPEQQTKVKATFKFAIPRPITKENEYKYKVPERDTALVEQYQQELCEKIDQMKKIAPYRSIVQIARGNIRKHKEWLHNIIGFKSPELPTWFGMIRYELDEPNASTAKSFILDALSELNLSEELNEKYHEIEEKLQKQQKAEIDTKAFLGQESILEAKQAIYLEHRAGFTAKLATYADKVDEKYAPLFNTQKGVCVAWDMYVITQFHLISQMYNKLYGEAKGIFTKLATNVKTQTRVFSYEKLNFRWLPQRRFVRQIGFNQSVLETLQEMNTDEVDYSGNFQIILLRITREKKTGINARQMRFFLDDTEYT